MIERMLVRSADMCPRLFPLVTRADVLNALRDTRDMLREFDGIGSHFDFVAHYVAARKNALWFSFIEAVVRLRLHQMKKEGRVMFVKGRWFEL
jgi:hypothetical protein